MFRIFICAALAVVASPAWAVQCKSVAGHINGERTKASRTITIKGNQVTLSGSIGGQKAPRRRLGCEKLATGVLCADQFQTAGVTLMTNRNRAIETVTDIRTGTELASFSYQCSGPVMMR